MPYQTMLIFEIVLYVVLFQYFKMEDNVNNYKKHLNPFPYAYLYTTVIFCYDIGTSLVGLCCHFIFKNEYECQFSIFSISFTYNPPNHNNYTLLLNIFICYTNLKN